MEQQSPSFQSLGQANRDRREGHLFRLIALMMGTIFLLLLANLGLFIRMISLQSLVIEALGPFQPARGLETGSQAPSFSLVDLEERMVSLDEWRGRDVLLVFSSTTCPACQQFWPTLQEFHQAHPGLALLMISRGTREENLNMVKEEKIRFPVLQWEDEIAQEYKLPGTPYLYLLTDDRTIRFAGFAADLDILEELLLERQS